MSQTIAQKLQDLEAFFEKLGEVDGFEVYVDRAQPAGDEDIAKIEQVLGYAVHPEIAAMWRRGVASISGTMSHDSFVAIGRDFCSTDIVLREIAQFRDVAQERATGEPPEPGSPTATFDRLVREGFPLSFENPMLASDASGAIFLVNMKDLDAREVGGTLSQHLTAWLAAGGFSQLDDEGGGRALIEAVRPLLPAWARGEEPSLEARAAAIWRRLDAYFRKHDGAMLEQLGPPASNAALDALTKQIGIALPAEVRALYRVRDGGGARVLPQGAWFRSLDEIAADWPNFAALADENFEEAPVALVEDGTHWDAPFHRAWIPFATREDFDLWIDLAPGPNGVAGQVLYPRDEASVVVVGRDLLDFLERWANLLESGALEWSEDLGYPAPRGGEAMIELLRAK
jgi:cell wall assembly regulator SMI1